MKRTLYKNIVGLLTIPERLDRIDGSIKELSDEHKEVMQTLNAMKQEHGERLGTIEGTVSQIDGRLTRLENRR